MTASATEEDTTSNCVALTRAIISVSDKTGLTEFAQALTERGVEIYSTGGTRRHLEEAGLVVQDISSYTGFPEMMDGRLKTLHPKVFGGILARHDRDDDMKGLEAEAIRTFELVVVNLYPFEQTVAREGVTDAEAIEQIDIGGPSLVRAAAKNHRFTTILTSADQYAELLDDLSASGSTSLPFRRKMAGAAFARTAAYDQAIAGYFASASTADTVPNDSPFDTQMTRRWQRQAVLRYGENPHQQAALYATGGEGASLVRARQLNGKELSYNNLLDLDAALGIVRSFEQPCVVVIKHNNPCGIACSATIEQATSNAMAGDPVSAFGSVLGFNRIVDAAAAEVLVRPGLFIEAIVAPGFEPAAVEKLTTIPKWKKNVRLMELGELASLAPTQVVREVNGGVLVQEADTLATDPSDWQIVTETKAEDGMMAELKFAWDVVRHVRSNAIAVCNGLASCGIGAGQMSRVDAVDIALSKAGERTQGAVLSSDAFFPFPDSIHKAAAAGIAAVIQPGGSKKDSEVIAACNEHGLAMIFTGRRHFKH
jgi:phosphoribosylaminoimidazolecarboxamide formyltransferase/IMP cyclohydrolase